jgi:integral membrane sensor domain MASE1
MRVEALALPTSLRGNGRPRLGPDVVALILVGFAYFALANLGLRLASINPSATPIWPPTGLAIAAILLWGNRIAPAIFIGAFLINQLTAGSIFTSLAIACGNTLEAMIAGYLIRHWAEGKQVFETPIGVTKFALISLAATVARSREFASKTGSPCGDGDETVITSWPRSLTNELVQIELQTILKAYSLSRSGHASYSSFVSDECLPMLFKSRGAAIRAIML